MANRTVIIDCDEQGNYSVGEEPHESAGQEGAESQGTEPPGGEAEESGIQMQPAKSLDDALNMARQIFGQAQQDNGDADQAMQQGYQSVAGTAGGGPGGM